MVRAAAGLPHSPVQHDAQLDFYGKKLATCSSDATIKVFDVQNGVATGAGETLADRSVAAARKLP